MILTGIKYGQPFQIINDYVAIRNVNDNDCYYLGISIDGKNFSYVQENGENKTFCGTNEIINGLTPNIFLKLDAETGNENYPDDTFNVII